MQSEYLHLTPHPPPRFKRPLRAFLLSYYILIITLILTSCQEPPEWIHRDDPSTHQAPPPTTSQPETPHTDPIDHLWNESDDTAPYTPLSLGLDKPQPKVFERPLETSPITPLPTSQENSFFSSSPPPFFKTEPPLEITFLNDPQPAPKQSLFIQSSSSQSLSSSAHYQSQSQFSISIAHILASAEAAVRHLAQRQNSIASFQSSSYASSQSHLATSLQFFQAQSSSSSHLLHLAASQSSSFISSLSSQSSSFQSSISLSSSTASSSHSSSSSSQNPFIQAHTTADATPPKPTPDSPHSPSSSPPTPILILIPQTIDPSLFQETSPSHSIELLPYATDAEALALLQSKSISLAILPDTLLGSPHIRTLIKPIPEILTPLLQTIDPLFTTHYFDPENKYTLPFFHTSLAIAHRKDAFTRPIQTWQEIITMLKNPTPTSPNHTSEASPPTTAESTPPPEQDEIANPTPSLKLLQPLQISLPNDSTLHPALWAKMQDLTQRRAPSPPPWWPTKENCLAPPAQASLIIEESHLLIRTLDPKAWHIILPKEGTLTRLYSITIPKNNPHPLETITPIVQTLLSPTIQNQLPLTYHLASPLRNSKNKAPTHPYIHIIYPPTNILDQSQFALPP